MNKQQLAAKIWASANKMRSKIEANEYKDYILGFIFYKFLSDKEETFLLNNDWSTEELPELHEEDTETVQYCQEKLGYFISYKNLYSTWLKKGRDFNVGDVRDALSAFNRLISDTHKNLFANIFNTLETGLSKLGESAGAQTKAINDLLQLIKDIPTSGNQDYDVLGFIYEYLISNFAANAGKKAGEFYTPYEVSVLMSEIIAHHLQDRSEIEIYDPTSGSGSLLINIGRSVGKYIANKDNIKYYAQEIKENTYNLTRMNLVMRDILPDNIKVRNGDTLEDDWPYFDDNDKERTYTPLYVDAVVSNPPYSQAWDPSNKENDPRYAKFGLAPKGKADYAFLLHDLYHVKPDGIMTIVLPHGVLFRGGEEEKIRMNLIENNHIDAIIGLPANIFFGTGIPTIVIVLRQARDRDDVLIVDASKGFVKEGKNNKLRACDIKKIADTVIERTEKPKFSKKVSRQEIRDNDYNLNIPRYVDSSDDVESWDIYASMFGGIPNAEIDDLARYWEAFPTLRAQMFASDDTPYATLASQDVKQTIENNAEVQGFIRDFKDTFASFPAFMHEKLIDNLMTLQVSHEEKVLTETIFERLSRVPLIDRYQAYQLFYDQWLGIQADVEIIQTEGFETVKKVDPNMVTKKRKGKDEEMQEGWKGRILPFELVQETMLTKELNALKQVEADLETTTTQLTELIDNMTEEEKEGEYLNEANDAFVKGALNKVLTEIYDSIESDEINSLLQFGELRTKKEKLEYIENNPMLPWHKMERSNDGTFNKTTLNNYIKELRMTYPLDEDTIEYKLVTASQLLDKEADLKSTIKEQADALHALTKTTIEELSDEEAKKLLDCKWIVPLQHSLTELPNTLINQLVSKAKALAEKYAETYVEVEKEIRQAEISLSQMIDHLEGSEFDMKGLCEFQTLLGGRDEE